MAFRKRTYAGFKRKRGGNFVRPAKRRRFTRVRRGRNNASYSTQSGSANPIGFRSRRVRPRQFQRILWRDTVASAHYRSLGAGAGSVSTPVGSNTMTVSFINAMDNGSGAFWTTAGGALPIDTGITLPLFQGDITVRGGMIGVRFYNDGAYAAHVMCYLVKAVPRPDNTIITSPQPVGWDPSTIPDFSKDFGKVIMSRRFIVEPLAMMSIEKRIWPMKIDQVAWATDAQRLYWLFGVSDGDTSGQDNIRIVPYFNLSFSADAIGTT